MWSYDGKIYDQQSMGGKVWAKCYKYKRPKVNKVSFLQKVMSFSQQKQQQQQQQQ